MRRVVNLSLLCFSAGLIAGCDLKEVYPVAPPAVGGVRFINAVPDSAGAFGMDLRFVDILESNAHFRQGFRSAPATAGGVTASTGVQFKATAAGSRHFRIFLDDTLQSLASVVMKDTTVNIVAGQYYTAVLWGYANPGGPDRPAGAPAMRLTWIEETFADPGTGIGVRVFNATPLAIDVAVLEGAATQTSWLNVPALSASTHTILADTGTKLYNVQPAGGGPVLFANATTLIGAPQSSTAPGSTVMDIEALPGTRIAGSSTSLIVHPPSMFRLPRVAKHVTTVAANQGRVVESILPIAGGFQITDSLAAGNPFTAGAFAPIGSGGYFVVVVRPPGASLVAPDTVLISANGTGTIDTAENLAAVAGPFNPRARYDIIGFLPGPTSIWDRRPAYINPP